MAKTQNTGGNGQVTRVAFYTRISTDEDHQKYSLGAQSERLEAFCKAQYGDDWRLHKLYRDTESGTHMNRPGLEEMLFDVGARAFDTLLVFRVDRLSRKVRELAQMVDELTKNGVALKSITEPFDTANAAGKMMLQMLGVFAEFEHATIVERTKVGMEKKAKGGKFVGGNVPYGFLLDPEKGLVINEDEALIVRKMFQMYAFGKEGSSAICNQLNEAGNRNRNGRKWGRRVILHMLRNPVYVGKIRWREVSIRRAPRPYRVRDHLREGPGGPDDTQRGSRRDDSSATGASGSSPGSSGAPSAGATCSGPRGRRRAHASRTTPARSGPTTTSATRSSCGRNASNRRSSRT